MLRGRACPFLHFSDCFYAGQGESLVLRFIRWSVSRFSGCLIILFQRILMSKCVKVVRAFSKAKQSMNQSQARNNCHIFAAPSSLTWPLVPCGPAEAFLVFQVVCSQCSSSPHPPR
jgi:hypothetical protein